MMHLQFPSWAHLWRQLSPVGLDLDDPRLAGEGDLTSRVLRRKSPVFATLTGLVSGLALWFVPIFLYFAFNVPRSGSRAFRSFGPWLEAVWPIIGPYAIGIALGGVGFGLLRRLTFRIGRVRVRAFGVGVLLTFVVVNVAASFVYEHPLIFILLVPTLLIVLMAWLIVHDLIVLIFIGSQLKDILADEPSMR